MSMSHAQSDARVTTAQRSMVDIKIGALQNQMERLIDSANRADAVVTALCGHALPSPIMAEKTSGPRPVPDGMLDRLEELAGAFENQITRLNGALSRAAEAFAI